MAPGNRKTITQFQKKDDRRNSDDRLADLLEWEKLTDNLEDTNTCIRTHFSGLRFQNVVRNWYQIQGSTVFILTSQTTGTEKSACEPKTTRALCRRRIGGALPRAEKFGDLITADHKILSEGCEPRDNHRYAVVVQYLATIRAKQRLHTRQKRVYESSSSRRKNQKLFLRIFIGIWESCEDLAWNHRTSTPHRSETNGVAGRAVRRVKEGTSQQYCYNQDWMKNGWLIFWNAVVICESPRPLGRRENSVKTIWRTIPRVNNSLWSNGSRSSGFSTRSLKTSSIWRARITWYLSCF